MRGCLLRAPGAHPTRCTESQRVSLCSEFVLVEQPAEAVAPADTPFVVMPGDGIRLDKRRLLLERAVRPMRVVCAG